MKRWLLALLVLAAVIVFVSPGIVGHLAERQMQQNAEWANQENADVALTTESFDRGWFSSVGRHRLSLSGTDLAAKMGTAVGDEAPSIIFDTRVDHGILPFTSLSGDAGSLKPGLARTVSTMQLDPGDGELVPLPGKIFSEIGLSGEVRSVGQTDARLKEAAKLGFARALAPSQRGRKSADSADGLKVDEIDHLQEMIGRLNGK